MKYCITILLVLIGSTAWCQSMSDSIATKRTIDSLKLQIKELKYAKKQLEYDDYLKNNLYRIDTVHRLPVLAYEDAQDSIVIHYLSRDNKLIKTICDDYIKDTFELRPIHLYSRVCFYNTKGLLEYFESRPYGYSYSVYDTDGEGRGGGYWGYREYPESEITPDFYFREKRDAKDSVILSVMFFRGQATRIKYCMSDNGNYIPVTKEYIGEDEFWDDK
jgi:hypothetical protein